MDPAPPPTPEPLSTADRAALEAAAKEAHTLLRPARVATVNGWTIAVFGGLSLLWALTLGGGLLVAVALLGVAWNEFRGRDRLRALDPEGARILGWNQCLLAAVVATYCGFAIASARAAPDPSLAELREAVGISTDVVAQLTTLVYGAVIVVVVVAQGLLARWHFARGPRIEAFLRDTPDWIVDVISTARSVA